MTDTKSPALGIPRYASPHPDRPRLRFGRPPRGDAAVHTVELSRITPNPAQPRRFFEPDAIASLADSIRRYGIIQPLTVRPLADDRYELIAGERRLRAAALIGMTHVPCILLDADSAASAALAIIENLQRENLTIFEQAEAISSLIRMYALTQDEIASRLSVSQSFVANKLRLLRFLPDERELILTASLTERHARAMLRLPPDDRLRAIQTVIERHWNVAETEAYVESLLAPADKPAAAPSPSETRRRALNGNVRLLYNSVNHAVELIRQAGIPAEASRRETDALVEIVIRIPKEKCFT